MGRHGYPTEFRRRALDLIASGRKVCRRGQRPRDQRPDGVRLASPRAHRSGTRDRGVKTDEGTKLKAAKKKIPPLERARHPSTCQ